MACIFFEPIIIIQITKFLSHRDAISLFTTCQDTFRMLVYYRVNDKIIDTAVRNVRSEHRCIFTNIKMLSELPLENSFPEILTVSIIFCFKPMKINETGNLMHFEYIRSPQSILLNKLSYGLRVLKITCRLNGIYNPYWLPDTLEEFYLTGHGRCTYHLPSTLKKLSVVHCHGKVQIPHIPLSLNHLTIGGMDAKRSEMLHSFAGIIFHPDYEDWYPLPTDYEYEYEYIYEIPESIQRLVISRCVTTDIKFPPNLTYLDIDDNNLANSIILPDTIKKLKFKTNSNIRFIQKYPSFLKTFSFDGPYLPPREILPATIKKLTLGCNFIDDLSRDKLPTEIMILKFNPNSKFNKPIDDLPDSITYLKINRNFTQKIRKLPSKLQTLCLPISYKKRIKSTIPAGLKIKYFAYD